jgi:hypothetical protein
MHSKAEWLKIETDHFSCIYITLSINRAGCWIMAKNLGLYGWWVGGLKMHWADISLHKELFFAKK